MQIVILGVIVNAMFSMTDVILIETSHAVATKLRSSEHFVLALQRLDGGVLYTRAKLGLGTGPMTQLPFSAAISGMGAMQPYGRYAAVESTVTRVVPFLRCLSRASPQQAARPYPIGYFHCVRASDGPFALPMTGLSARPIFFEVQVCAEIGWGRFRAPGPEPDLPWQR